jgi:hypothetical protein
MSLANDIRSIPELFGDAVEQLGKLVQNEVQLARAELSEKLTQAGMGVAYLGAAAIFLIPVLVMLLITLALWFVQLGMSPVMAHLLASALGGLLCAVLAFTGMSYLKPDNLKPKVTMREVQRDVAAAKEIVK